MHNFSLKLVASEKKKRKGKKRKKIVPPKLIMLEKKNEREKKKKKVSPKLIRQRSCDRTKGEGKRKKEIKSKFVTLCIMTSA